MTARPLPGRHGAATAAVALALLLGGCASVPAGADGRPIPPSPQDPWERFNRSMYAFNDAVDRAVVKPVATAYRDAVPQLLRTWVGNFFGNVADAWSSVNHLLQGKPADALHMGMRVATNTVLGLGGVLDIATEARLDRRSEDFGQTLGRWGVPAGPYLVLPLLGPSSVRDTAALPLDLRASAALAFEHTADRAGLTVLDVVHRRSTLLDAGRVMDDIALDRYQFMRDAYLQRRRSLVLDGRVPADGEEFDYEDYEDDAAAPAPPPASK